MWMIYSFNLVLLPITPPPYLPLSPLSASSPPISHPLSLQVFTPSLDSLFASRQHLSPMTFDDSKATLWQSSKSIYWLYTRLAPSRPVPGLNTHKPEDLILFWDWRGIGNSSRSSHFIYYFLLFVFIQFLFIFFLLPSENLEREVTVIYLSSLSIYSLLLFLFLHFLLYFFFSSSFFFFLFPSVSLDWRMGERKEENWRQ